MSFPNAKVLEDAKEQGWPDRDIEQARIQGFCNVNDIVLTHLHRYRYARMQFCMSKNEIRKIKKHLKDCPVCSQIVEESMQKSEVKNAMSSMKIKVIDFIMRNDMYSRKDGSKKIREYFGDDGYQYYQDLWKRGCLRVNDWACLVLTMKGHREERIIKEWDVQRSGETPT